MENRDVVMNNIKKIEFILNSLFKKVNKDDNDESVFDFFNETLGVSILDVTDEEFYETIKHTDGMSSENIVILINILQKLSNSDFSEIIQDKIFVLNKLLNKDIKIFYYGS